MARLELVAVYHNLTLMPSLERCEYRAWKGLLECDLTGHLYGFKVLRVAKLQRCQPFRKTEGIRSRGCITELEFGESERLSEDFLQPPRWLSNTPRAVRQLPAFSLLAMAGASNVIWLPDLPGPGYWKVVFSRS